MKRTEMDGEEENREKRTWFCMGRIIVKFPLEKP